MILAEWMPYLWELHWPVYADDSIPTPPPTHHSIVVEMLCTCLADDCKNHRRIIMQGALRILLRSSEAISTAKPETKRLGPLFKNKRCMLDEMA